MEHPPQVLVCLYGGLDDVTHEMQRKVMFVPLVMRCVKNTIELFDANNLCPDDSSDDYSPMDCPWKYVSTRGS